MRRIIIILSVLLVAAGANAQMVNNIPNYLYSGALGVGRNVANDANVYLQVGPNGAATKGFLLPRVADTASVTGTKRNGLLIYSNQLGAFAYFDSTSAVWRKLGYTDTTVISTKANAQKVVDDTAKVLRALASTPDGVTSVATGYGISGGTITSTGTISSDTSALATKLWAEKAVDDTAAVLRTAINAINPSASLSSLTAATGTNTINNADYAQEWQWNSLTLSGLKLSSTSTAGSNNGRVFEIARSGANASSSRTSYGIYSRVLNTGTSSTNTAGYFNAANGTTNIGVEASAAQWGVLAAATATESKGLEASSSGSSGIGVYGYGTAANSKGVQGVSTGTTGTNYGIYGESNGSGATTNYGGYFTASGASVNYGLLSTSTDYGVHGTATAQYGQGVHGTSSGADSYAGYFSNTGSTGVKYAVYSTMSGNGSNNYGLYSYISGAATTNYGTHSTTVGAGTTNVGGYFKAINATNNHALVTDGGNTGFGTTTPVASALVELSSTTQGLLLPRMTKTQRDAISSPVAGLMIYQTDNTPGLRVYNGTNWMRFTETTD